jgi:glycerol-3-phosphate dehydrogenase
MHEDALSRDHRIVDHAQHGAPGFFSMLGGKLASYRLFAEEMSDVVALRLSKREKCQTHSLPLPGGEEHVSREQMEFLAQEFLIDELSVRRLVARHGSEARSILESSYETPEQRRIVCACEPVTEVEIRHTLRHEWARSVEDVSRRTRLGLGQCGGMRCALECGRIVAEERDQSPAEGLESAAGFLRQGLRKRLSVMGPEQARQEALSAAHIYAQSGILLGEER